MGNSIKEEYKEYLLEDAKKDVKAWIKFLEEHGYIFPENTWGEVTVDEEEDPECLSVKYEGELSFEQAKQLSEELRSEFPDADLLYEEHKNEEGWDYSGTKCCLDYDKFYLPDMESGLCLWVWTYNEKRYGMCMTNWW